MEPAGGAKAPPDGAIRERDIDRGGSGFRHRPRVRATCWLHPGYDAYNAPTCATIYCETVCTTLETGRVLATGTFRVLISASSYSGNVCSDVFALICTTL
jgi:hypothetical protein